MRRELLEDSQVDYFDSRGAAFNQKKITILVKIFYIGFDMCMRKYSISVDKNGVFASATASDRIM